MACIFFTQFFIAAYIVERLILQAIYELETVCYKKQEKKIPDLLVTGLRNRGPLKDLNDFKLIVYESM